MLKRKLTQNNFHKIVVEASDMLKRGQAIVYPTDTLYALGVDALNDDAVKHFCALKKRPANKAIPLFVKNIQQARELAFIDARQEKILMRAWPGPYTFVLYKRQKVSMRISAGTQTVGLRMPDNAFAQALLHAADRPITASSANISGKEPESDPKNIIAQFAKHSITPDYFVDAGILHIKTPSTVIDITSKEPKILRIDKTNLLAFKKLFIS